MPPAMPEQPDHYAVVVGVQDYPGVAGAQLTGAVADALEFKKWLREVGVPASNIFSAVSGAKRAKSPEKAVPGVERIKGAFKEVVSRLQQGQSNGSTKLGTRLYIFLAGHGFEFTGSQPALLAADASPAELTHIPGKGYAEYFRESTGFDEIILFMDCCRSLTSETLIPVTLAKLIGIGPKPDRFYAFATLSADVAREKGSGGKSRGAFTSALLDGLRGGAERNGQVTDESLADYVRNRFKTVTDAEADAQVPEFETSGKLIVLTTMAGKRYKVALPGHDGKTFKITGKGGAVAVPPTPCKGATISAQLPNGKYALYLDDELTGTFVVAGKPVVPADLRLV